jgi:hypothetical protein
MAVDIKIDGKAARELEIISKRLKKLGNKSTIPKEFRKALRSGTQPAARDAKIAARALPSKTKLGRRKKNQRQSLRRAIANATAVQVKLGGSPRVAIRVSKRQLGDRKNLPRLLNRGGWDHPTYGHEPTVHQQGSKDWYDDVMRKAAPEIKGELQKVLNIWEKQIMSDPR